MRSKKKASREAEACVLIGNYQGAIDIYRQLVAESPAEESFLLALAWAYYDAGRQDEAINCFELLFAQELSRKIFTGFAYDELVRIFKANAQYGRLVEVCAKAVQAQPDDIALLGELGTAYLLAGMPKEARAVYRRAIAREPEGASLYCLLGETYLAGREFVAAEKTYRRAAELDPEAACSFWSRLASHYGRIGEYQREARILRTCLKLLPLDPLYHCRLGDCLINKGQLTAATAAYERAIALSPAAAAVLQHRWGNTLAAAQYPDEARRIFSLKSVPFSEASPS